MWEEEIKRGESLLSLPDVLATSKLRDALNAAWLCRLYQPDSVVKIDGAAQELCNAILEKQKRGFGTLRQAPRDYPERRVPTRRPARPVTMGPRRTRHGH